MPRLLTQFLWFIFAAIVAPWMLMSGMLLLGYPDLNADRGQVAMDFHHTVNATIGLSARYSLALAPAAIMAYVVIFGCARGLLSLNAPKELIRTITGLLGLGSAFYLIIIEAAGFYMPITWPTALLTICGVCYVSVCQIANGEREVTIAELWHERRRFIR